MSAGRAAPPKKKKNILFTNIFGKASIECLIHLGFSQYDRIKIHQEL